MPAALLLALAIASEVIGTTAMRSTDGFSRLAPSIVVVIGYGFSFYLLSLVLRDLDLGLVYAIWAGVGTALIAAISMAAFGEPVTALKVASIALIVAGVVGLNLDGLHG